MAVTAETSRWCLTTTTGFFILLFVVQGSLSVLVEVTPKEVVALPGQNVTFLCRVGVPIQYCRIEIPGEQTLNLNPALRPKGGIAYYGAGLQAGQCGVTIDHVKEINNGLIKCSLGIQTEYQEPFGEMRLTVAKAPRAPQLEISTGTDNTNIYKVGDVLRAYCIVRDGRPVANISWYLDDMPILEDLTIPTITDMAKEELYSIEQNLTRTLVPSDNGRSLRCLAEHPAFQGVNNLASRQLNVKYPPLPLQSPIDKFGYEIGQMGIISIEFEANPKPHVEWTIRDNRLREGTSDISGRIEAEVVEDLGKGRYRATLRIAAISKQDTETQYVLTAYNDMGSQDYSILISTSPEPEGLDLGIASIIGIVVAILIVILIVFVVVFARVTGRWCFSGRSRRSVAESDTESVEVRQREQKRILPALKIQIPPLFKKNKEKEDKDQKESSPPPTDETKIPIDESETQTAPVTATTTPNDGKEGGLVYAELDLVSQNLRPVVKNEEDKTEYAEIVYAQKENEEKIKSDKETAPKATS
ncbi:fasciclin-3 isoform X2 [Agrilus planipennis]|uniref:Fasciclin-3 isoform X2 n=1 Tax=Agrilus planipennis TaxID=224129 RepID=A0A7F5R4W0_AGRPL|nr:fasciclin-3 isoform X2 [Agrilus planipennis]